MGFRYILDGMNAERILIAAECIGDGYWFIDKARNYATDRIVFDRPIGKNQGVQFPLARAYASVARGRSDAVRSRGVVRCRQARGRRSQHGQAAGGRTTSMGGGQHVSLRRSGDSALRPTTTST
jgi:acyl-CoA dehydrogenase